jgi:transcriptional regulator PpsR
MHQSGPSAAAQSFRAPELYFADLSFDVAAAVIAAAADVALVLDGQGVIRDIALGASHAQELAEIRQWVGRRWVETVTIEGRGKVTDMLAEATGEAGREGAATRSARQVTHALTNGMNLPVSYKLVPMGAHGRLLALGQDLREVASVQQRLIDAQQSMERDYLRLRHTEARYRLLFEAVDEAVLVLEADSWVVLEHNTAFARLLGDSTRRVVGRSFVDLLAAGSQSEVLVRFQAARNSGRSDEVVVRLAQHAAAIEWRLAMSVFKQENTISLLVRLSPVDAADAPPRVARAADTPPLVQVVNAMPDAFVLTDMQGRIASANQAFHEMLQLPPGESVQGQPLDRWLGRSSVDLSVLIGNLRQHGVLRLFPTSLRGPAGESIAVEICAVAVPDATLPSLGFSIRDVARRLPGDGRSNRQLPRSAEQLTGLVGRLPLKDIVGETTDLIERLCIEAALELTRSNRASAAEMLGLSRQSLYVKLRRYGMHGGEADSAED